MTEPVQPEPIDPKTDPIKIPEPDVSQEPTTVIETDAPIKIEPERTEPRGDFPEHSGPGADDQETPED